MRGRGRGRGGRSGRGRGGRSGGRGRSANQPNEDAKPLQQPKEYNVDQDVMAYFVGNASCDQHYEAQEKNFDRYTAAIAVLKKNGVELLQNAIIRCLATALTRHEYKFADALLQDRDICGVNEVLKAVALLDSGRQVRVLEKRLKQLQVSGSKVKPTTLGKLKSDIDNLNKNKPLHGTASSSVCKYVQRWVRKFTKEELEFYALFFPKEPWKKLADICHFNPTKDFPTMDWFLPFCYGCNAPEGSYIDKCRSVTDDTVNDLLAEFPLPFAQIKTKCKIASLTDVSKAKIAECEAKLDTVLWDYEDIRCEAADRVILNRVRSGEPLNLPNGKLLERLLTIKMYREGISSSRYRTLPQADKSRAPFYEDLLPIAQAKIDKVKLSLESPIVVVGDASGSMEVAIRTSSIIAGILTALTSAKLVFFNTENRYAPFLPKTIEEVLKLAVETHAGGGTTPAASLWPFYHKKEIVKTFIVVTDEEENGKCNNMEFHELYKKYHDEVFPAKLVFVSFFYSQHQKGSMVTKLQELGYHPLQFVFSRSRPDLTKLDKLFGLLSASDVLTFEEDLTEMQAKIKAEGLLEVFSGLSKQ